MNYREDIPLPTYQNKCAECGTLWVATFRAGVCGTCCSKQARMIDYTLAKPKLEVCH